MPISTSDLSTIFDYSSPFTAPHISSKQIFVFSLASGTTLPATLGNIQLFFILTVDPFYIPLLSFNLFMPQLPLLCLHRRESCLLAECVSPALDSAHCYRDHRDRFSPDVKQCRSAGVQNHEPQRKRWTYFQCQSRRSEWNWYLQAQNQQEAVSQPAQLSCGAPCYWTQPMEQLDTFMKE